MGQHLKLIPDATFTAQMMVSAKHNTTELRLTVHFPVLLGLSPHLSVQPVYHQGLYPPSIPTSLRNDAITSSLCHSPRIHRRLRRMVSRQCLGKLRTYRQVLGSFDTRFLFRSKGPVVLELGHSHPYRSHDLDIPNARTQIPPTAQEAEAGFDGCFRPRWIVSKSHSARIYIC